MIKNKLLIGEKVSKRFGGLNALTRVDFHVEEGEILGLIGPNGSGKTTLINVISGFYKPDEGQIFFKGERISKLGVSAIAKRGIGRTFQFIRPFEEMTALDNIVVGVLFGGGERSIRTGRKRAMEILDFVGLGNKPDSMLNELMMAERKRLEMGRALSINPSLILLDEVFAGLNDSEVKESINLVFKISQKLGITIIMIEHVLTALMQTCQRVMVLDFGNKIADGRVEDVVKNPQVIEAYLGATYARDK